MLNILLEACVRYNPIEIEGALTLAKTHYFMLYF